MAYAIIFDEKNPKYILFTEWGDFVDPIDGYILKHYEQLLEKLSKTKRGKRFLGHLAEILKKVLNKKGFAGGFVSINEQQPQPIYGPMSLIDMEWSYRKAVAEIIHDIFPILALEEIAKKVKFISARDVWSEIGFRVLNAVPFKKDKVKVVYSMTTALSPEEIGGDYKKGVDLLGSVFVRGSQALKRFGKVKRGEQELDRRGENLIFTRESIIEI